MSFQITEKEGKITLTETVNGLTFPLAVYKYDELYQKYVFETYSAFVFQRNIPPTINSTTDLQRWVIQETLS